MTLEELRGYERRLVAALGNPNAEVWYDEFKKKSRPVSELKDALAEIRKEIARHPDNLTAHPRPRMIKIRNRSAY